MKLGDRPPAVALVLFLAIMLAPQGRAGEWVSPPKPVPRAVETPPGPFQPAWPSLAKYQAPDWFRDAKFGIFVHWGPQTLAGQAGSPDGTKSPPKELMAAFTGEKFDAARLARLFRQAGARYVVQVAEHHDAYALYDSSFTPFSSVRMKPKRDFVAEFSAAARNEGLVFGLSSHTEETWWFYSDPPNPGPAAPRPDRPPGPQPDPVFLDWWYARLVELVDRYQPQIFWFDWSIEQPAYEPYLRRFAAHYYNRAAGWKRNVVLNYKYGAFPAGAAVLDVSWNTSRFCWDPERIQPLPWQFDTMSNRRYWFWRENMELRPLAEILCEMADVVSKNGNYLLNLPPAPDGTLTPGQEQLLAGIGRWLGTNGEAIYGTRPWRIFGEGPTRGLGPEFQGNPPKKPYGPLDIRFTTRDGILYAIALACPESPALTLKSLAGRSVKNVALLGSAAPVAWSQVPEGLILKWTAPDTASLPLVFKIQ